MNKDFIIEQGELTWIEGFFNINDSIVYIAFVAMIILCIGSTVLSIIKKEFMMTPIMIIVTVILVSIASVGGGKDFDGPYAQEWAEDYLIPFLEEEEVKQAEILSIQYLKKPSILLSEDEFEHKVAGHNNKEKTNARIELSVNSGFIVLVGEFLIEEDLKPGEDLYLEYYEIDGLPFGIGPFINGTIHRMETK